MQQPLWIEHPVHGRKVDVVVFPLPLLSEGHSFLTINKALELQGHTKDFNLAPSMDAFILGFPLQKPEMKLPLWKRGTIASEPDQDIENLPYMLLDTATREGMSGAPVIAQIDGPWNSPGKTGLHPDTKFGKGRKFIGVYSGRWGADEFRAQLGIVWKVAALDEIIDANTNRCESPSFGT